RTKNKADKRTTATGDHDAFAASASSSGAAPSRHYPPDHDGASSMGSRTSRHQRESSAVSLDRPYMASDPPSSGPYNNAYDGAYASGRRSPASVDSLSRGDPNSAAAPGDSHHYSACDPSSQQPRHVSTVSSTSSSSSHAAATPRPQTG